MKGAPHAQTPKQPKTLEVRISDINYGNHMGNDRALSFFQDARISFLKQLGRRSGCRRRSGKPFREMGLKCDAWVEVTIGIDLLFWSLLLLMVNFLSISHPPGTEFFLHSKGYMNKRNGCGVSM